MYCCCTPFPTPPSHDNQVFSAPVFFAGSMERLVRVCHTCFSAQKDFRRALLTGSYLGAMEAYSTGCVNLRVPCTVGEVSSSHGVCACVSVFFNSTALPASVPQESVQGPGIGQSMFYMMMLSIPEKTMLRKEAVSHAISWTSAEIYRTATRGSRNRLVSRQHISRNKTKNKSNNNNTNSPNTEILQERFFPVRALGSF